MKLRKKKGYTLRKYNDGGGIPGVNNVRDLLDALSYDIRPGTFPDTSGDPDLNRIIANQAVAESTAGPRIDPPKMEPEPLRPLPPQPIAYNPGEIRPLPDPVQRNALQRILGYGATMVANPMGALKYAFDPSTTPLLETTLENYRDDMRDMHTPMGSVVALNPYSFRSYLGEQAHEKQLGRFNLYDYLSTEHPLGLLQLIAGRGRVNLNRGMPVLNQVTGEVDFGTRTLIPNRFTQSILNRRQSGAAAQDAAAAEEAFLSEGMGEASVARGPGASGSTSIPKRQPAPSHPYGDLSQQVTFPSWRMLRNQPNISARDALADTDVNKVFIDAEGQPLTGDAFTRAKERFDAANQYQRNVLEAHKDIYLYEGNVRQLPSLVSGSKLENGVSKDGSIQVSQVQALIDKGGLSKPEAAALQEALDLTVSDAASSRGLETVDRVDWGVLKRNANAVGDPFELVRKPTTIRDYQGQKDLHHDSYQAYGVDNLFVKPLGEGNKSLAPGWEELNKILATTETNLITTDVPELRNSERGHFGKEVTGHYRTFRVPDEPDVLYVSELQADPLQARKEEYVTASGEEIQTRQLSANGARRYDDNFRKFQQETAIEAHNALADLNMAITDGMAQFTSPMTSVAAVEDRLALFVRLKNMYRDLYRGAMGRYDYKMQKQMAEEGGIKGFHDVTGQSGVRSIPLFGGARNPEFERLGDMISSTEQDLISLKTAMSQHEQAGVLEAAKPRVEAEIQGRQEDLEQDINDLQQAIRDVQDNVSLFEANLQAGYNGQLTPLQAKMVKDQDKFLVGQILQAESQGAKVIRFPRGETVRTIQGYETADAAYEDAIDSANLMREDAEDAVMFLGDHNPYLAEGWVPSGQSNTLKNMDPEEFVEWHDNIRANLAAGNEQALKDRQTMREFNERNVKEKVAQIEAEALRLGYVEQAPNGTLTVTDPEAVLKMFHRRELYSGYILPGKAASVLEGDMAALDDLIINSQRRIDDNLNSAAGYYRESLQHQQHAQGIRTDGGTEEILSQEKIMDGYERLTKAFDKHNLTYREVTDDYGNGWYEVDVPANFHRGAGEVRAYRIGGRIPMKVKKKKPYNLIKK